jgi:hypothetical protein
LAAKRHNDTTNLDKNFDYESMILNKVKSSDSQDIGTITLIIEDILALKIRITNILVFPKMTYPQ